MDFGIAIDLAGRGLQDARAHPLGEAQHVDGAVDGGFGGLHRVELIVHRRGGAGEIVYLVDFHIERERHVVTHRLKARRTGDARDIILGAGEIIVDAQHVAILFQQPLAEVRADKAGAAGHQYAFCNCHVLPFRLDHSALIAFHHQARQLAAVIGAGIDADPVGPALDLRGDGMSVDDAFAVIGL